MIKTKIIHIDKIIELINKNDEEHTWSLTSIIDAKGITLSFPDEASVVVSCHVIDEEDDE